MVQGDMLVLEKNAGPVDRLVRCFAPLAGAPTGSPRSRPDAPRHQRPGRNPAGTGRWHEKPDIIVGLEPGADDYLVKPVCLRQLPARVRAVSRPVPASAPRGRRR
jgi:hypothetical protein